MRHLVLWRALPVLLVLSSAGMATDSTFRFSVSGPWRLHGAAGETVQQSFGVWIDTTPGDGAAGSDGTGAQAWTLSIAGEGWTIVDATTAGTAGAESTEDAAGLRSEGFEDTQIVDGGVVSAVVLSYVDPVLLPMGGVRVLSLVAEGVHGSGGCESASLCFEDGLQGTGLPVSNRVTRSGRTVVPSTACLETLLCEDGPFDLRIGGALDVSAAPGTTSVDARTLVLLDAEEDGIQGWSMSVESRGPCEIAEAGTEGTIAADAATDPQGLRNTGFEKTEVVDPADNGGRNGVVHATVLSFTMPIFVPAGTHALLNIDLRCDTAGLVDGDEVRHQLSFPSNLGDDPAAGRLTGSGQAVKTALTLDGETVEPDVIDGELVVTIATPAIANFLRCDPNADARTDIADAIWIVNELFRGGPPTACADAADCNDDEARDLSDVVFAVSYLFEGGSAPPAPFGECGLDDDARPETCPTGSTSCS